MSDKPVLPAESANQVAAELSVLIGGAGSWLARRSPRRDGIFGGTNSRTAHTSRCRSLRGAITFAWSAVTFQSREPALECHSWTVESGDGLAVLLSNGLAILATFAEGLKARGIGAAHDAQ
jgi:hypothetical protein